MGSPVSLACRSGGATDMPGLIGVASPGPKAGNRRSVPDLSSALKAGLHSPTAATWLCPEAPNWAAIGALYHSRDPDACQTGSSRRVTACVYGEVGRDANAPLTWSATEIAEDYAERGSAALNDLSGSYVCAILDRDEQALVLQVDRQGKIPVCYSHGPNWFCFGPEAKVLFQMVPLDPSLNTYSALEFLREGFLLPGSTMFNRVRRVVGGERIRLDLNEWKVRSERYWSLRFRVDRNLTLRSAATFLYEGVEQAHRRVTEDAEGGFGVFLTGGIDSRGIAAMLDRIDSRPARTLTWCGRTGVPQSDEHLAKILALQHGYSHETIVLDAGALSENVRSWLFVSELATDNLGFALAPVDVFSRKLPAEVRFMLVGDEFFGHGIEPEGGAEAISYVLKSHGTPSGSWLRGCVRPSAAASLDEGFEEKVAQFVSAAGSTSPRDLVDHLTLSIHRPAWSYSAGNCKEPGVPVRRPYMQDNVLDLISTFPPHLRDDKRVYFEMLRQYLPEILRTPRPTANSLFDWPYHFRRTSSVKNVLRSGINSEALLNGPLAHDLDCDRIRKVADEFFKQRPNPNPSRNYGHYAVNIRRALGRFGWTRGLSRSLSHTLLRSRRTSELPALALIRRLALLGLFIELIENGHFSPSRHSSLSPTG